MNIASAFEINPSYAERTNKASCNGLTKCNHDHLFHYRCKCSHLYKYIYIYIYIYIYVICRLGGPYGEKL